METSSRETLGQIEESKMETEGRNRRELPQHKNPIKESMWKNADKNTAELN